MKNFIKKLTGLCLLVLIITFVPAYASESEWQYFDLTAERLKKHYIDTTALYGDSTCKSYVNALQEDGTFFFDSNKDGISDIDYDAEPEIRVTATNRHLQIMRAIARAANEEGHYMYENPDVAKEVLERSLEGWCALNEPALKTDGTITYPSKWWNHTIGPQTNLMPILVMGEHLLDDEHMELGLSYLCDHEDMYKYPEYQTGANLTWYTTQGIVDGLLSHDYRKLQSSVNRMKEEIQIFDDPSKEGLQEDFSFHQHGRQYLTSYGSTFINDSILYLSIFDDTDLSCSDLYKLLENRLLDGCRWEKWGKVSSLNLAGRTISYKYSPSTGVDGYVRLCDILLDIYPEGRTDEIKAFKEYLNQNSVTKPAVLGNKYFWCSDYMVHNRENYSVSYKTVSNRTEVSETNSRDNLLGENIGLGSMFLSKEGDIHHGSQVSWDWSKIPGVTMGGEVYKRSQSGMVTQRNNFVGGVSDGKYGASVFDFSLRQTDAKKSVFFFDDEYVSLGSGITSTQKGVATTVEQRFRLGKLYVDAEEITTSGTKVYENVGSVLQNNIGYVFPEATDLNIKNDYVTGKWSDLGSYSNDDTEYTNNMFVMWIDHGDFPVKQSYSYITIPEISYEGLQEYTKDIPVEIISNTESLQAVFHKKLNVGAAAFYKSGECSFGDVTINVNKPCILLLKKTDDGYEVSTANPKAEKMNLDVDITIGSTNYLLTFNHPGSEVGEKELGGITLTEKIVIQ